MKIVTYAHPQIGLENLKKSCFDITVLSVDNPTAPFKDKVNAMLAFLKTQPLDEYVMFVDGYDVVFLGAPDWLGDVIMFNAEKGKWTPDIEQFDVAIPKGVGLWHYLNSGCYVGRVENLLKMVSVWAYMLNNRTPNVDDQSAAQAIFAASALNITIDDHCYLFQCYSFLGENEFEYLPSALHNIVTGTYPSVIHCNGKTPMDKVLRCVETGFDWMCRNYVDTIEFHTRNKANFDWFLTEQSNSEIMNKIATIRKFVRDYVWGFGENCFAPLWWMLCRYIAPQKVLEIGVFKGQTLAYVAASCNAQITGVGLFERGGNIPDWDFSEQDTYKIFDEHGLDKSVLRLIKGDSMDSAIVQQATDEYDIVYVDGDHSYNGALSDLRNYAPMVRVGGLLVIDDCATDTQVPNGWFGGIVDVTNALRDYMAEHKDEWQFCFSLVHDKIFKRIA